RALMESVLGAAELREELNDKPANEQVLHIDLTGRDPDDGMTRIPYEKGALFLRTMEELVGRKRFDAFLRSYFDRFAFQSITTADFLKYLKEHFFADENEAGKIDLASWLEAPGLPGDAPRLSSARLDAADRAAAGWTSGAIATDLLGAAQWTTH